MFGVQMWLSMQTQQEVEGTGLGKTNRSTKYYWALLVSRLEM